MSRWCAQESDSARRDPTSGAHTATAVPDPARDSLYLYVGGSSNTCQGMDIARIKISNPSDAVFLRRALSGGRSATTTT